PSLRYGQPALLDCGGGLAKLATLKQRQPLSLLRLRCSAQPGRGSPKYQIPNPNTKQGHAMACPCGFRYSGFCLWLFGISVPTPCGCAEERRFRRIRDRVV